MSAVGDSSSLDRGLYCRREFHKRVASYFKAGEIELGRVTDDILQSMEFLVLVMWHNRGQPENQDYKDAFDNLLTAAGRLKVESLSSLLGAVAEAQRNGDSFVKALSELVEYFNLVIG